MRSREAVLVACVVLAMTSCKGKMFPGGQGTQSESAPSATAQEAAQTGLTALQGLVNENNFQGLGFGSVDQVKSAQLGAPLSLYSVRLDALTGYKGDPDASALVQDAHKTIYPVVTGEQVLSSVSVTQRGDGWRATDFGDSALTKALVAHKQSAGDVVVWVPALKIYFTARGTGSAMMLTPIMDDPRFDLKAGEGMAASNVFGILQRGAAGYNGLPQ
jgi:hypothetical protein